MNRETFLKTLQREKVLQETWIEQLKKEKLPLVMWGCGDVGDAVSDYLEYHGIHLSGIWVDGASGRETYKNLTVDDLSGILNKFDQFNVILGHSYYEKGEELSTKISQINKVFYAFSIQYGQYAQVEYGAIKKETERFVNLCNQLSDQASERNLLAFLNTKMTGDVKYIFDVYEKSMSFYQNDVFSLTGDDVFLDIGAYNGDTIRSYLQDTGGKYKKIIALEPDCDNYLALSQYVVKGRLKNVWTSMLCAWNKREDLQFVTGKKQICGVCCDDNQQDADVITCYADRIDEMFGEEEISFIQINYFEGVLEAIEGCENIIKRYHPKLAIDVGFNIYNVLLLFEYLASLDLGYQFYLRFNHAMSSTFTMYVV